MIGIIAVLILAFVGAGLIVAGAYVLAGVGVALLACGVLVLAAAKLLSRGLNG